MCLIYHLRKLLHPFVQIFKSLSYTNTFSTAMMRAHSYWRGLNKNYACGMPHAQHHIEFSKILFYAIQLIVYLLNGKLVNVIYSVCNIHWQTSYKNGCNGGDNDRDDDLIEMTAPCMSFFSIYFLQNI